MCLPNVNNSPSKRSSTAAGRNARLIGISRSALATNPLSLMSPLSLPFVAFDNIFDICAFPRKRDWKKWNVRPASFFHLPCLRRLEWRGESRNSSGLFEGRKHQNVYTGIPDKSWVIEIKNRKARVRVFVILIPQLIAARLENFSCKSFWQNVLKRAENEIKAWIAFKHERIDLVDGKKKWIK